METTKSTPQLLDMLYAFTFVIERIAVYDEDLEQLLQAIIRLMTSMPEVSYASIFLLNENEEHFYSVSTYGVLPIDLNLEATLNIQRLMECPAEIGQTMMFTELVDDSEYLKLNSKQQQALKKLWISPLVVQQRISGLICVYGVSHDPDNLNSELFCLWASLASLAIEKSHLYNQLHKQMEITRAELKRSETHLIRSEKLSSLAEIVMSVAHTIRNPVTVIGALSRRIREELPEDDPKHQWSEIVISEASRLESLVKEFKRFFSINRISFRTEDINRLVEGVADDFLSQCRDKPRIMVKRSLSSDPLMCRVDPDLLARCLVHLLTNACEASANGILITLASYREGEEAIIQVTDSGRGISDKEINKVFDPFYTSKGEGAGMGLTFVHFVISEHSGQVELRSEEGMGTRFRIRLPLEVSL
ncbi:MAG: ATP-binding protein [Desulfobacteraceae bacterium]|jgi:signal transduction histidine kinase